MKLSAKQIAELFNGVIEGDENVVIDGLTKIEEGVPGKLTFLANPVYTNYIYSTKASIVIVNKNFIPESKISATLIRVDDAYSAFAKLLQFYNEIKLHPSGISDKASISKTAVLGKDIYIGDFVVVGEHVVIEDGAKIYPNVTIGDNVSIGEKSIVFSCVSIYSDTKIGKYCTLHSGVVLGSDGFVFVPQKNDVYEKIAQTGNVVIEDYVEIGANTTIDRATLGSTIIHKGVKLDNLIQIAHNVEIDENTVIAAQTGISGSTKIGRNCMIGGQVGIAGHLIIADDVKIAAQSGISSSILKKGAMLMGAPAFEHNKYKRSYVFFKNLEKIVKRIDNIEKKLNNS